MCYKSKPKTWNIKSAAFKKRNIWAEFSPIGEGKVFLNTFLPPTGLKRGKWGCSQITKEAGHSDPSEEIEDGSKSGNIDVYQNQFALRHNPKYNRIHTYVKTSNLTTLLEIICAWNDSSNYSYGEDFVVERHGEKGLKVKVFLVHAMWI